MYLLSSAITERSNLIFSEIRKDKKSLYNSSDKAHDVLKFSNEAKSFFMDCECFEAQLKIGRLGFAINDCVSAVILGFHAVNTSGVMPPPP